MMLLKKSVEKILIGYKVFESKKNNICIDSNVTFEKHHIFYINFSTCFVEKKISVLLKKDNDINAEIMITWIT